MNIDAKALLKAQRITTVEIDEIKENISLKIGVETEDYANEENGGDHRWFKRSTRKKRPVTRDIHIV